MSRRFQIDPNGRDPIYEFPPGEQGDLQPNIIYIRPRMSVAIHDKVKAAAAHIEFQKDAQGKVTGVEETDIAGYLSALLIHNIVAWEGPDFDGLPCTSETIMLLPGNDPFIERVRGEIAKRNQRSASPSPKSPAGSGFSSAGRLDSKPPAPAALTSHELATGIARSSLRSALDGRLNKSENSTPTI